MKDRYLRYYRKYDEQTNEHEWLGTEEKDDDDK